MSFVNLFSTFMTLVCGQTVKPDNVSWCIYLGDTLGNLWAGFCQALASGVYSICKWLLAVVDFLQYFIQKLIGLDYWLKSEKKTFKGATDNDMLFKFLYNDMVQKVFKTMTAVFVVLLIIFTVVAIIRQEWGYITGGNFGDGKNSKNAIIFKAVKAIALVLVFPMILLVGVISSNAILASLVNALNIDMSTTFGGTIFSIAAQTGNKYRIYADQNERSAVSQEVTFYVNSDKKCIMYGSGNDNNIEYVENYHTYLVKIADATEYKINSVFEAVNPKKYEKDNPFSGYCVEIEFKDGDKKPMMVYCDSGEKEAYYYYLKNILNARILTRNDIFNKNIYKDVKNKMTTRGSFEGFISNLRLDNVKKGSLADACYNSWNYVSVYMNKLAFEDTLEAKVLNNAQLTNFGVGSFSSANVIYNSGNVSPYIDGGQFGVVQMRSEYYVAAEVIDFINEKQAELYIVDATSSSIQWDLAGYRVDDKWKSVKKMIGRDNYLNFMVSYSENCPTVEMGNVLYTAKYNVSDELEGSKYIYCWKRGNKYVPLINGYEDGYVDEKAVRYDFKSSYYSDTYRGVVFAKGVFDTSSTNQQFGEPTYIRTAATANDGKNLISIGDEKAYYYKMQQSGSFVQFAEDNGPNSRSLTLQGIKLPDTSSGNEKLTPGSDLSFQLVEELQDSNGVPTYQKKSFNDSFIKELSISVTINGLTSIANCVENVIQEVDKNLKRYLFVTNNNYYFCVEHNNKEEKIQIRGIDAGGNVVNGNGVAGTFSGMKVTYNLQYKYNRTGGVDERKSVDSEISSTFFVYAGERNGVSTFRTVDMQSIKTDATVDGTTNGKPCINKTMYMNVAFDTTSESLVNFDGDKLIYAKPSTDDGKVQKSIFYDFYLYSFMHGFVGTVDSGTVYKYVVNSNGTSDADSIDDDTVKDDMKFGFSMNEDFTWALDSTELALYDGKTYVATIYKNKQNSTDPAITQTSIMTESTKILYDNKEYYNIKKINRFNNTADFITYFEGVSDSIVISFYRDNAKTKFGYLDENFAGFLKGEMRLKISFFVKEIENEMTGYFTLDDGLLFDYFFDNHIALRTFYVPSKVASPFGVGLWIIVIASALIINVLGTSLWGVIKRFYEITLYYLAMPAVASTMPLDEKDTRFKTAIQTPLIGKVLSTYGVILGINAFFVLLAPVRSLSKIFTAEDIATSGSYFLKHLPISVDLLNGYVYLLFLLVAFTMIKSLPGTISAIVTGKADNDILKSGGDTQKAVNETMKTAGSVISGQAMIDKMSNNAKNGASFIPGGAIAKKAAGGIGNLAGGIVDRFKDDGAGSDDGEKKESKSNRASDDESSEESSSSRAGEGSSGGGAGGSAQSQTAEEEISSNRTDSQSLMENATIDTGDPMNPSAISSSVTAADIDADSMNQGVGAGGLGQGGKKVEGLNEDSSDDEMAEAGETTEKLENQVATGTIPGVGQVSGEEKLGEEGVAAEKQNEIKIDDADLQNPEGVGKVAQGTAVTDKTTESNKPKSFSELVNARSDKHVENTKNTFSKIGEWAANTKKGLVGFVKATPKNIGNFAKNLGVKFTRSKLVQGIGTKLKEAGEWISKSWVGKSTRALGRFAKTAGGQIVSGAKFLDRTAGKIVSMPKKAVGFIFGGGLKKKIASGSAMLSQWAKEKGTAFRAKHKNFNKALLWFEKVRPIRFKKTKKHALRNWINKKGNELKTKRDNYFNSGKKSAEFIIGTAAFLKTTGRAVGATGKGIAGIVYKPTRALSRVLEKTKLGQVVKEGALTRKEYREGKKAEKQRAKEMAEYYAPEHVKKKKFGKEIEKAKSEEMLAVQTHGIVLTEKNKLQSELDNLKTERESLKSQLVVANKNGNSGEAKKIESKLATLDTKIEYKQKIVDNSNSMLAYAATRKDEAIQKKRSLEDSYKSTYGVDYYTDNNRGAKVEDARKIISANNDVLVARGNIYDAESKKISNAKEKEKSEGKIEDLQKQREKIVEEKSQLEEKKKSATGTEKVKIEKQIQAKDDEIAEKTQSILIEQEKIYGTTSNIDISKRLLKERETLVSKRKSAKTDAEKADIEEKISVIDETVKQNAEYVNEDIRRVAEIHGLKQVKVSVSTEKTKLENKRANLEKQREQATSESERIAITKEIADVDSQIREKEEKEKTISEQIAETTTGEEKTLKKDLEVKKESATGTEKVKIEKQIKAIGDGEGIKVSKNNKVGYLSQIHSADEKIQEGKVNYDKALENQASAEIEYAQKYGVQFTSDHTVGSVTYYAEKAKLVDENIELTKKKSSSNSQSKIDEIDTQIAANTLRIRGKRGIEADNRALDDRQKQLESEKETAGDDRKVEIETELAGIESQRAINNRALGIADVIGSKTRVDIAAENTVLEARKSELEQAREATKDEKEKVQIEKELAEINSKIQINKSAASFASVSVRSQQEILAENTGLEARKSELEQAREQTKDEKEISRIDTELAEIDYKKQVNDAAFNISSVIGSKTQVDIEVENTVLEARKAKLEKERETTTDEKRKYQINTELAEIDSKIQINKGAAGFVRVRRTEDEILTDNKTLEVRKAKLEKERESTTDEKQISQIDTELAEIDSKMQINKTALYIGRSFEDSTKADIAKEKETLEKRKTKLENKRESTTDDEQKSQIDAELEKINSEIKIKEITLGVTSDKDSVQEKSIVEENLALATRKKKLEDEKSGLIARSNDIDIKIQNINYNKQANNVALAFGEGKPSDNVESINKQNELLEKRKEGQIKERAEIQRRIDAGTATKNDKKRAADLDTDIASIDAQIQTNNLALKVADVISGKEDLITKWTEIQSKIEAGTADEEDRKIAAELETEIIGKSKEDLITERTKVQRKIDAGTADEEEEKIAAEIDTKIIALDFAAVLNSNKTVVEIGEENKDLETQKIQLEREKSESVEKESRIDSEITFTGSLIAKNNSMIRTLDSGTKDVLTGLDTIIESYEEKTGKSGGGYITASGKKSRIQSRHYSVDSAQYEIFSEDVNAERGIHFSSSFIGAGASGKGRTAGQIIAKSIETGERLTSAQVQQITVSEFNETAISDSEFIDNKVSARANLVRNKVGTVVGKQVVAETLATYAEKSVDATLAGDNTKSTAEKVVLAITGKDGKAGLLSSDMRDEMILSTMSQEERAKYEGLGKDGKSRMLSTYSASTSVGADGSIGFTITSKEGKKVNVDSKVAEKMVSRMISSENISDTEIENAINKTGASVNVDTALSKNIAAGIDFDNESAGATTSMLAAAVYNVASQDDNIVAEAMLRHIESSKGTEVYDRFQYEFNLGDADLTDKTTRSRVIDQIKMFKKSGNPNVITTMDSEDYSDQITEVVHEKVSNGTFKVTAWDLADESTKETFSEKTAANLREVSKHSILEGATEEEKINIIANTVTNVMQRTGNKEPVMQQIQQSGFIANITQQEIEDMDPAILKALVGKGDVESLSTEDRAFLGYVKATSGSLHQVNVQNANTYRRAYLNNSSRMRAFVSLDNETKAKAVEQNNMSEVYAQAATQDAVLALTKDTVNNVQATFIASMGKGNAKEELQRLYKAQGGGNLADASQEELVKFVSGNQRASNLVMSQMRATGYSFAEHANANYEQYYARTEEEKRIERQLSIEAINKDKSHFNENIYNAFVSSSVENKDIITSDLFAKFANIETSSSAGYTSALVDMKKMNVDMTALTMQGYSEANIVAAYKKAQMFNGGKDVSAIDIESYLESSAAVDIEVLKKMQTMSETEQQAIFNGGQSYSSVASTLVSEYLTEEQKGSMVEKIAASGYEGLSATEQSELLTTMAQKDGQVIDNAIFASVMASTLETKQTVTTFDSSKLDEQTFTQFMQRNSIGVSKTQTFDLGKVDENTLIEFAKFTGKKVDEEKIEERIKRRTEKLKSLHPEKDEKALRARAETEIYSNEMLKLVKSDAKEMGYEAMDILSATEQGRQFIEGNKSLQKEFNPTTYISDAQSQLGDKARKNIAIARLKASGVTAIKGEALESWGTDVLDAEIKILGSRAKTISKEEESKIIGEAYADKMLKVSGYNPTSEAEKQAALIEIATRNGLQLSSIEVAAAGVKKETVTTFNSSRLNEETFAQFMGIEKETTSEVKFDTTQINVESFNKFMKANGGSVSREYLNQQVSSRLGALRSIAQQKALINKNREYLGLSSDVDIESFDDNTLKMYTKRLTTRAKQGLDVKKLTKNELQKINNNSEMKTQAESDTYAAIMLSRIKPDSVEYGQKAYDILATTEQGRKFLEENKDLKKITTSTTESSDLLEVREEIEHATNREIAIATLRKNGITSTNIGNREIAVEELRDEAIGDLISGLAHAGKKVEKLTTEESDFIKANVERDVYTSKMLQKAKVSSLEELVKTKEGEKAFGTKTEVLVEQDQSESARMESYIKSKTSSDEYNGKKISEMTDKEKKQAVIELAKKDSIVVNSENIAKYLTSESGARDRARLVARTGSMSYYELHTMRTEGVTSQDVYSRIKSKTLENKEIDEIYRSQSEFITAEDIHRDMVINEDQDANNYVANSYSEKMSTLTETEKIQISVDAQMSEIKKSKGQEFIDRIKNENQTEISKASSYAMYNEIASNESYAGFIQAIKETVDYKKESKKAGFDERLYIGKKLKDKFSDDSVGSFVTNTKEAIKTETDDELYARFNSEDAGAYAGLISQIRSSKAYKEASKSLNFNDASYVGQQLRNMVNRGIFESTKDLLDQVQERTENQEIIKRVSDYDDSSLDIQLEQAAADAIALENKRRIAVGGSSRINEYAAAIMGNVSLAKKARIEFRKQKGFEGKELNEVDETTRNNFLANTFLSSLSKHELEDIERERVIIDSRYVRNKIDEKKILDANFHSVEDFVMSARTRGVSVDKALEEFGLVDETEEMFRKTSESEYATQHGIKVSGLSDEEKKKAYEQYLDRQIVANMTDSEFRDVYDESKLENYGEETETFKKVKKAMIGRKGKGITLTPDISKMTDGERRDYEYRRNLIQQEIRNDANPQILANTFRNSSIINEENIVKSIIVKESGGKSIDDVKAELLMKNESYVSSIYNTLFNENDANAQVVYNAIQKQYMMDNNGESFTSLSSEAQNKAIFKYMNDSSFMKKVAGNGTRVKSELESMIKSKITNGEVSVSDLKSSLDDQQIAEYLKSHETVKENLVSIAANDVTLTLNDETRKVRQLDAVMNNRALQAKTAESVMKSQFDDAKITEMIRQMLSNESSKYYNKEIASRLKSGSDSDNEFVNQYIKQNRNELLKQVSLQTFFNEGKDGKLVMKETVLNSKGKKVDVANEMKKAIENLSHDENEKAYQKAVYEELTNVVSPSSRSSIADKKKFFASENTESSTSQQVRTLGAEFKSLSSTLARINKKKDGSIGSLSKDGLVGSMFNITKNTGSYLLKTGGGGVVKIVNGAFNGAVYKLTKKLPKNHAKYEQWNNLIQQKIDDAKRGQGAYKNFTRTQREEEVKKLTAQIIVSKLPENYYKMSIEQQVEFNKQQNLYKHEAFTTNISKLIKQNQKISAPKNKNIFKRFVDSAGYTFDFVGGMASENVKAQHKRDLADMEALATRFNATKAMRNRRVDFGSNYQNFIKNYFNEKDAAKLDEEALKAFLAAVRGQLDANGRVINKNNMKDFKFGNLTDSQQKTMMQIREDMFASVINRRLSAASKKVAKDNKVNPETYTQEKGITTANVRYRNGAEKYLKQQSRVKTGGRSSYKRSVESKVASENRLMDIERKYAKILEFNKTYKGSKEDYKSALASYINDEELVNKIYSRYNSMFGSKKTREFDLERSSVAGQLRSVERGMQTVRQNELSRAKYAGFIPASGQTNSRYIGRQYTYAKTKLELERDTHFANEINNTIKQFSHQQKSLSYEQLYSMMSPLLKKGFKEHNKVAFAKYSDAKKKEELMKYLQRIQVKAINKVNNNTFFSGDKHKLVNLNGTYVERTKLSKSGVSPVVMNAIRTSGSTVYQTLVQNFNSARSKVELEEKNIERLSRSLKEVMNGPQNNAAKREAQKIRQAIESSRVKLKTYKSVYADAENKKKSFEQSFATREIKKAIASNAGMALNTTQTARELFNRYRFPIKQPNGTVEYVKDGTTQAKEVNMIIGDFLRKYRYQIQYMIKQSVAPELSEIRKDLGNDFGRNYANLKAVTKSLKAEIKKNNKKDNAQTIQIQNNLAKIERTEAELIARLKSLGINVGDIEGIKEKDSED